MSTPKNFSASIGACFAEHFSLELVEGTLTYCVSKMGGLVFPPERFQPTEDQWQDFRRSLDELQVWQWKDEYRSNHITDGAEWSLQIDYGDRAVNTQGCDSFPENFTALRSAVTRLLGGKTF